MEEAVLARPGKALSGQRDQPERTPEVENGLAGVRSTRRPERQGIGGEEDGMSRQRGQQGLQTTERSLGLIPGQPREVFCFCKLY